MGRSGLPTRRAVSDRSTILLNALRPDKKTLGSLAILWTVGCLIAATWMFTVRSIEAQRIEVSDRITARVTNQALIFSEQVGRQILTMDQTLRILARSWERDPRQFDLDIWRGQIIAVSGISRDMILVDENGIVRQSSLPEAVGRSVADFDFFRQFREKPASRETLFVGPATIDPLVRLWHLNVARALRHPDGSFAGAISLDYRVSALTDIFTQTNVGAGGLVAMIGLDDGRIRAAIGPSVVDPEATVSDTRMFRAMQSQPNGVWAGPSASDAVLRIHAFHDVPDRDLVIVVAMDEASAMQPATEWRFQARGFASGITVLLLIIAGIWLRATSQARKREAMLAAERAVLAASNAQLEAARAHASAKTEQLEATLRGMTDGVAMMDTHHCLVEWNHRFPEIAGIPPDMLRVGLPMEEILRAQALGGQFGPLDDVEAEISRRMERLRSGRFGTTERPTPDGRVVELRRNRLPDGGYVTLYSDITDRKRAENALREAQSVAETANAAKSRFVAIVSHEIRTPLNALLNTLRLMADGELGQAQRTLLDMASQSGDALSSLINDILEMSRAEAGQLTLRPSQFALRTVLEGPLEVFRPQAAARGINFRLEIDPATPVELMTDPGRLRQILLNLLSNAVKFAGPGEVILSAWQDGEAANGRPLLHVSVRDHGPAIPAEDHDKLFRPFSRLERPEGDQTLGSGLGLAICRHLTDLLGGTIACRTWTSPEGVQGNDFCVTLPVLVMGGALRRSGSLPADASVPAPETPAETIQRIPRTRVLLVEDARANQMVTATLLRRAGHMVDVADSGEKAIQLVKTNSYDIIFMDIFMPGMSGQEATQRIRQLPGPAHEVPILALTANVSPNDEANFREAGMNGLLGKPVSPSDLLGALRDHVWWVKPPAPSAGETEEDDVPHTAPEDADTGAILATDRLAELRANLPPETLVRLIEECLVDLDHRLPALRRAVAADAPAAVEAQSHAMVGIAAGYGLASLERRLRIILNAARDGDLADLPPTAVAAVEQELARGGAEVRAFLQKEPA